MNYLEIMLYIFQCLFSFKPNEQKKFILYKCIIKIKVLIPK